MTAPGTRRPRYTPRIHKGVDRGKLRREYDGGRGCTLAELATRHGVPKKTMQWYAYQDGWGEDRPRRSPSKRAVREAAHQLIAASAAPDPAAIRAALVKRFGKHWAIPTLRGIRLMIPKPTETCAIPELPPIAGLTRRCYSDECQGLITTSDPCHRCGLGAEELLASR